MQVSHRFTSDSAVFDDGNLVSCAGLVPVMTLAEQTGLPALLDEKVRITRPLIKSGSTNPAPKLTILIAGMCAGADSSEDSDIVRSGGMKTLFGGVYAPSTIGTLLREFTFGHARQLESVLREHLAALGERVDLLAGADVRHSSMSTRCCVRCTGAPNRARTRRLTSCPQACGGVRGGVKKCGVASGNATVRVRRHPPVLPRCLPGLVTMS